MGEFSCHLVINPVSALLQSYDLSLYGRASSRLPTSIWISPLRLEDCRVNEDILGRFSVSGWCRKNDSISEDSYQICGYKIPTRLNSNHQGGVTSMRSSDFLLLALCFMLDNIA